MSQRFHLPSSRFGQELPGRQSGCPDTLLGSLCCGATLTDGTVLCFAMEWLLICPLSMFSNDICGVGRSYLMPLPLCVKPGSARVPSSFTDAPMIPMPLVFLAPGTIHSSLTLALPGVNTNSGLPSTSA